MPASCECETLEHRPLEAEPQVFDSNLLTASSPTLPDTFIYLRHTCQLNSETDNIVNQRRVNLFSGADRLADVGPFADNATGKRGVLENVKGQTVTWLVSECGAGGEIIKLSRQFINRD